MLAKYYTYDKTSLNMNCTAGTFVVAVVVHI